MKGFSNKDIHSNLDIDIFGHKIENVFTKIGDSADEASDNDSNVGHAIGSILDALTEDYEIKIGRKDKR